MTNTTQQVPATMQAVVCHGPRDYRLEEVAVPTPGPGEALVRVEAVGICASDLKCYHGAAKSEFQKGLDLVAASTESTKVTLIPEPGG